MAGLPPPATGLGALGIGGFPPPTFGADTPGLGPVIGGFGVGLFVFKPEGVLEDALGAAAFFQDGVALLEAGVVCWTVVGGGTCLRTGGGGGGSVSFWGTSSK
jgi:hypothetical protein